MIANIIVLGGDNATTLQTVRCAYFASGIKPLLFMISKERNAFTHAITKSCCVGRYEICQSEEDAVNKIIDCPLSATNKMLIFASSDAAAEALNANYIKLSSHFIFPWVNKDSNSFPSLMKKDTMSSLALRCGFPVPKTYSTQDVLNGNYFPCILKPRQSTVGGKLIRICRNHTEFLEAVATYNAKQIPYFIQEFLPKNSEICLLGVAGFQSGKVFIAGAVQKIRESCLCGSFVKILPNIDSIIDCSIVESFIKATNYRGPFSIDLLQCNDKFYYLETNFRIDAHLLTFAAGGCNLLRYLYEEIENPETVFPHLKKIVYGMDERTDFWNVRWGEISFWHWIRDYFKTDCRYLMYSKDKRVFFFMLFFAVKQKFASLAKWFRK